MAGSPRDGLDSLRQWSGRKKPSSADPPAGAIGAPSQHRSARSRVEEPGRADPAPPRAGRADGARGAEGRRWSERGEITDDDRREAAERSGLPEATVYGVSTFYDDLLQPRGERHVRVCTGTACFAATGDAHVDAIRDGLGLELGERSEDGSVSLAETVCLGFCHSSPAVRDGDVIDAGPGVVERVLAGATRPARRAARRQPARRAGADRARATGRACARRSSVHARGAAGGGQGRRRPRPRRRRLPGRARSGGSRAAPPGEREVHRRQRRRGRPRLLHRQGT